MAPSVGGAASLTTLNRYRSTQRAMNFYRARRGDNTDLRLRRPLPADSRRQLAQSVPGVTRAEAQGSEEGLAHG